MLVIAILSLVISVHYFEWSPSYTLVAIIILGTAVTVGLETTGRLLTGSVDFRECTITIYWAGRSAHVWNWEFTSRITHLLWSFLMSIGILGLVAFLPAWLAKLGLDLLYSLAPFGVENFWAQLAVFAVFLAFVFIIFSHSGRFTTKTLVGIDKRNAYIQDADRLVQIGREFGLDQEKFNGGDHRVPVKLFSIPRDASLRQWWVLAMPIDGVDRVARFADWCSGSKTLSLAVVEHVEKCVCPGGGFGLWPGGMPRLGAAFHALNILNRAGDLEKISVDDHTGWILSCGDREGGFHSPQHACCSLKDTCYAVRSLVLLGRLELMDKPRCAEWVERAWYRSERSQEETRYTVICLAMLNMLSTDLIALLESCWLPRYWTLVLSMRIDKQIDHVWNYVQIVSDLFHHSSSAYSTWMDGLEENISEWWDTFFGAAA